MRLNNLLLTLLVSLPAFAIDVPGGLLQTAQPMKTYTYEMSIDPSFVTRPDELRLNPDKTTNPNVPASGAYLSSTIRYQPNDDFTAGFDFGAGELGYHFGLTGGWYVLPDLAGQPAVAIMAGAYFNRVDGYNYFVPEVIPIVSKSFAMAWGTVTPYSGFHFAPSFRLGDPKNDFSFRTSVGSQFSVKQLNGVRIWTEIGVGFINSFNQISVGLSYPFSAIIGS